MTDCACGAHPLQNCSCPVEGALVDDIPDDEPDCWMWTLLVDDIPQPGYGGDRKSMQIPSFHTDNAGIIEEVESRFKTKVVEVRGKVGLYARS